MNSTQLAKLKMYSAVISVCDKHEAVIASIPALKKAVGLFKETNLAIERVSYNEAKASPGISLDKKQVRDNLAQVTANVALNAFAYADETSNNELKARVNYTKADLLRLKDHELPGICRSILEAVTGYLPQLAEYGVTAESLAALNDAIDGYNTYVSLPRNMTSLVSQHVSTHVELFKRQDRMLKNRIDKMITALSDDNLVFRELYFNNRIIIDPHTTSTQIKGTVTSKDKNKPLRGVTIKVLATGQTFTSDIDGRYTLRPLSHETYSVEYSLKGYETVTVDNIDVKLGQIARRNVVLVPLSAAA